MVPEAKKSNRRRLVLVAAIVWACGMVGATPAGLFALKFCWVLLSIFVGGLLVPSDVNNNEVYRFMAIAFGALFGWALAVFVSGVTSIGAGTGQVDTNQLALK